MHKRYIPILYIFCILVINFLNLDILRAHSFTSTNVSVDYEANLTDGKITLTLEAASHHFDPLLEIDPKKDLPKSQPYLKDVIKFLEKKCPLKVDNIEVIPSSIKLSFIPEVEYLDNAQTHPVVFAVIKAEYPIKKLPKTITFNWGIFPIIPEFVTGDLRKDMIHDRKEVTIQLIIKEEEEENYDFFSISKEEPEYIWHTGYLKKAPEYLITNNSFGYDETIKISTPVLTSIFLSLYLFISLIFKKILQKKIQLQKYILVIAIILLTSFIIKNHGEIIIDKELINFKKKKLTIAQAEKVFGDLLTNIYRAFDYTDEDEIYFVLSQSVTGDLLEKVFGEIYKSLIQKDQGGAISKVKKIDLEEVVASELNSNEDQSFKINASWTITGIVKHFKHIHARKNKYQAEFTLVKHNNTFIINNLKILNNQRIDDPQEAKRKQEILKTLKEMEISEELLENDFGTPK